MHPVARSVRERGGLAATHELLAAGHGPRAITAAVQARNVIRVRQGWYASRDIHPLLIEAARVGGAATCVSGLSLQGCWTVPTSTLHVAVSSHASRLRSRGDKRVRLASLRRPRVIVHWREVESGQLLLSPLECLTDAISCQPPDLASALADSLLHRIPQLKHDWTAFVNTAPATHRSWLQRVDGVCESGTETLFWFRMRHHRFRITRQVTLTGIGRVDFLIGEWLVVEVDGAEYHTETEQFESDRRRDALLGIRGYRVLRFSYRQVLDSWEQVEAAVLAAVVRGDHQ